MNVGASLQIALVTLLTVTHAQLFFTPEIKNHSLTYTKQVL
jgi:hypothetical protein